MIVLGVTGTIGAGKDVVSSYLRKKHGFKVYRTGDIARDVADEQGRPHTREVLQNVYVECKKKYGQNYFINLIVKKIRESGEERVIIDGVRGIWDVKIPRKEFGKEFILLKVDAEPETRFKRLKKRRRTGFPKTLKKFREHERREYKIFGMHKTLKEADKVVNNDNTLEELYSEVDKFVKSLHLK